MLASQAVLQFISLGFAARLSSLQLAIHQQKKTKAELFQQSSKERIVKNITTLKP